MKSFRPSRQTGFPEIGNSRFYFPGSCLSGCRGRHGPYAKNDDGAVNLLSALYIDRNEQACAVLRAHPHRRRGPELMFRASCFRHSGADQYPVLFSILGMTSVVLFGIGHKYILGAMNCLCESLLACDSKNEGSPLTVRLKSGHPLSSISGTAPWNHYCI